MNPTRKRFRAIVSGLFLVVASCLSPVSALSDGGSNIEAGRELASTLCARCHAIGAAGMSPSRRAPPFRTLAAKWPIENLGEALAEGIVVGHKAMPEFELEPAQISDFLAYLRSVQQKQ